MDVIKGILHEEFENALKIKSRYEQEMQGLPTGSIFSRSIKGHQYYYLTFRHSPQSVRQKYLGRLSEEEAHEYKSGIEKRRRYESQIRELKKKISYLRKVLHVKAD